MRQYSLKQFSVVPHVSEPHFCFFARSEQATA